MGGKTWANLGEQMSEESCKAACLSEEQCNFAIFGGSNSACSAFASCDGSKDSNTFFQNWQKVPVVFEMVRVSEVPEGQRCGGLPISLGGKTWANLGEELSQESCKAACLSEELCSFAVLRRSNGACSAFASCDGFVDSNIFFDNWQK